MQNRCDGRKGQSKGREIEVLRSLVVHRIYISMRPGGARLDKLAGPDWADLFDYTCNSRSRNMGVEYSLLTCGIQ